MVVFSISVLVNLFTVNVLADSVQIISASPGSGVTLNGHTSPNIGVSISCTGTITMSVNNGRYSRSLDGIYIPSGSSFNINAQPVSTLEVSGSFGPISDIVNGSVSGSSGSLSMSGIPSGTYDITVFGDSSGGSVSASVTASQRVTSDSNGDYSISENTGGLPTGVYQVTANGQTIAEIYLGVTPPATPTPTVTPTPSPSASISPNATATSVTTTSSSVTAQPTTGNTSTTTSTSASNSSTTGTTGSSVDISVTPPYETTPAPSVLQAHIAYIIAAILVVIVVVGVLIFWWRK